MAIPLGLEKRWRRAHNQRLLTLEDRAPTECCWSPVSHPKGRVGQCHIQPPIRAHSEGLAGGALAHHLLATAGHPPGWIRCQRWIRARQQCTPGLRLHKPKKAATKQPTPGRHLQGSCTEVPKGHSQADRRAGHKLQQTCAAGCPWLATHWAWPAATSGSCWPPTHA
jgi:hypothetical protein